MAQVPPRSKGRADPPAGRWMLVQRYSLPDGRNVGLWIDISVLRRIECALTDAQTVLQAANEA